VTTPNQNPEQIARDQIDKHLVEAGWIVQDKTAIGFSAGPGIAVREYQTDIGPADYVLFVAKKAVAVIEAKPEEWGHKITTVEEQSGSYAAATLTEAAAVLKNEMPETPVILFTLSTDLYADAVSAALGVDFISKVDGLPKLIERVDALLPPTRSNGDATLF
jgi:type I site-specific restriction endonuclease